MIMIKSYSDALNFIHGRTQFKKIPTLDRMRLFLERLGNPQEGLKYVHITELNMTRNRLAMKILRGWHKKSNQLSTN